MTQPLEDEIRVVCSQAQGVLNILLRLPNAWTHYDHKGNLVRHDRILQAKDDVAQIKKGLDALLIRSHKEAHEASKTGALGEGRLALHPDGTAVTDADGMSLWVEREHYEAVMTNNDLLRAELQRERDK